MRRAIAVRKDVTGHSSAQRRFVPAIALLFAACQHAPPMLPPTPPPQVEAGATFALFTPLAFPAGRLELFFQNQRLIGAEGLSRSAPYCKLMADTGAARTLAPQTFRVTNVSYDERESGNTSAMFSITRISLAGTASSATYTLSCGWPDPKPTAVFVTTEQIYSAVGGQFTMQSLR